MGSEKYQFISFLKYPNIIHGISTKAFGSMKDEDLNIDQKNLRLFAESLGITDEVISMQQIHSGNVANVSNVEKLRIPETDALVTDTKNLPLVVLTADCLPIMLYDPKKEVIGLVHAGYKGLLQNIIRNTVQRFISDFDSNPADITVGIGPSIETSCYEVGEDVISKFEETFPTFRNMSVEKEGKYYLNLREITQQCLLHEGIMKDYIEIMDICTKCDDRFYSYRGGDTNERFASIILPTYFPGRKPRAVVNSSIFW